MVFSLFWSPPSLFYQVSPCSFVNPPNSTAYFALETEHQLEDVGFLIGIVDKQKFNTSVLQDYESLVIKKIAVYGGFIIEEPERGQMSYTLDWVCRNYFFSIKLD